MKKIIIFVLSLFLISGCSQMMNTPTKEVENFLSKYQKQDESVISQLNEVVDRDYTMNDEQKESYKELMKRQYQNLIYKIKDEKIDGDKATLEVEIEVFDYKKAVVEADKYLVSNNVEFQDQDGNIDKEKFTDYKIQQMKNTKEKITYTITLNLTKKDKEWKLDTLSESDRQKIHGTYNS